MAASPIIALHALVSVGTGLPGDQSLLLYRRRRYWYSVVSRGLGAAQTGGTAFLRAVRHNRHRGEVMLAVFACVWMAAGTLVGYLLLGQAGLGASAFALMAIGNVIYSYFYGTQTILRVSGAVPADPEQQRDLFILVRNLVSRAALPMPAIYVMQDPSPNAFTTGRDPAHAALTVTTGLLSTMDHDELEGVLAHELTHVKNRDIRLLLVVATVVGLAALLASWAWNATARISNRDKDGRATLVALAVACVMSLLAFLIGPLIQLAVSRTREFLADAGGTRLAAEGGVGLIHALQKIEQSDRPLTRVNHATAAMFIDNPLEHHHHWFNGLFDTHPPIEERIGALQRMAGLPETAEIEHEWLEAQRQQQAIPASREAATPQQAATQTSDNHLWETILGLLLGVVLLVVFRLFPLWTLATTAVLGLSLGLGLWCTRRLRKGWRIAVLVLYAAIGLGIEVVLYVTGLWPWALGGAAALLTLALAYLYLAGTVFQKKRSTYLGG